MLWARESLALSLLVDSGADGSFIDKNLARQAGLPLVEFSEPKAVLDLDGRTLAKLMHRTASLTLLVSGNHREQTQFFLILSSFAPAILGSPWLAHQNLQIDWSTRSLAGWSAACHTRCICKEGRVVTPLH